MNPELFYPYFTKLEETARYIEEHPQLAKELISYIGEDKCIKLLDLKKHYPSPDWYSRDDNDFWNTYDMEYILTRIGELDEKDIELFKQELEECYPTPADE